MTNVLIRFSFIFKTICTTPAVHLFINLWMPHHKSTYWQHKVLHSNASSKKKEKEIYLENDIREKKKKERSCYLQCNSAKPAVRQNHSTPQQISVSRTEANLVFTNESEVRCSKSPTNQRRC